MNTALTRVEVKNHLDGIVSRLRVRSLPGPPSFTQRWLTVSIYDPSGRDTFKHKSRLRCIRYLYDRKHNRWVKSRSVLTSPIIHLPSQTKLPVLSPPTTGSVETLGSQWATTSLVGYALLHRPLAINFVIVGKVKGAVLSNNTLGLWIRISDPDTVVLIEPLSTCFLGERGKSPWWTQLLVHFTSYCEIETMQCFIDISPRTLLRVRLRSCNVDLYISWLCKAYQLSSYEKNNGHHTENNLNSLPWR